MKAEEDRQRLLRKYKEFAKYAKNANLGQRDELRKEV